MHLVIFVAIFGLLQPAGDSCCDVILNDGQLDRLGVRRRVEIYAMTTVGAVYHLGV